MKKPRVKYPTIRSRSLLAISTALALIACGRGAAKTPEAALAALVTAANNNDGAAFRAGFPDDEQLAASFECPPDLDLAARYRGLSDELVAWRAAKITRITVDPSVRVAVGQPMGGCVARVPVTVAKAGVVLDLGGREVRSDVRFITFEDGWKVLAL